MFPKSDILESLLEGDGVSGSPRSDKGLPATSRVVLGGVVGVFSTMIEGISAVTQVLSSISLRRAKRWTLFMDTTEMLLEPPSVNDHLEEGPDSIQVDQICDEFICLRPNHEIFEPR